MSDDWVEVLGSTTPGGRKYYWHRYREEVRWEAPRGVRVVWVMERHPVSRRVYYRNKDTQESFWTLPHSSGSKDGPEQPRRVRLERSGDGGGGAAKRAPGRGTPAAPTRGRWRPRCRELPPLGRQLAAHAASLPGVRDCTSEVSSLLPGEEGAQILLFECDEPLGLAELLPQELLVVGPAESTCEVTGYVAVDVGSSPEAADAAVDRLARCWWALARASPRFVTLVFAAELCAGGEAGGAEEAFAAKHRRAALRAPAPLVFAALRSGQCCSSSSSAVRPQPAGPEPPDGGAGEAGPAAAPGARQEADRPAGEQHGGCPGRRPGGGMVWARRGAGASPSRTPATSRPPAGRPETEERLVARIRAFLKEGPREVQELASAFAVCFNAVVRADPHSPYSADKKNDGSFKRWLVARGFQAGPLFERNKSLVSLPAGNEPACTGTRQRVQEEEAPFRPPRGLGTPEACKLQEEVTRHLAAQGTVDMGALRQVNGFGARFNNLFFQRSKVNDGSWKRWLASLPELEVVVDPRHAAFHRNCPTAVRWRRSEEVFKSTT